MEKFTQNTKVADLRVHGDFIFGLPGETEKTIKKTIAWAKTLGIEGYQFLLPQPHPGTPLFDQLKRKGFLNKKGETSYPHLSHEKLSFWRFHAMKEIYFSPHYLLSILKSTRSLADWKRLLRIGLFFLPSLIKK